MQLQAFLKDFSLYLCDNIMQLLQILHLHIHEANLLITKSPARVHIPLDTIWSNA